jgi:starch synthase
VRRSYRVQPARIAQIFNPIDTSVWRPAGREATRSELGISADAVVAIWHGQVQMHRKGLDLLVEAWSEIERARPGRDLELLLVGSGIDAGDVQTSINARGLRGARLLARWVNDRAEMARLLSAADLYVFPSRHEGFPLAPVEAMACGLPVVATDAQGVPDILAGGAHDGGVVVGRDDVRALTDEIGELIDDPERRRELGRQARARAEGAFSIASVGQELRRVLLREGS